MTEKLNEYKEGDKVFGTGAMPDSYDPRDKPFTAVLPFDWELGFDIELVLGYRATCKDAKEFFGAYGRDGWGIARYKEILEEVKAKKIPPFITPTKDQGGSYSCVGQSAAFYISVLNFIDTGKWLEISARDIYAYISLGEGQGAYLRDALKLSTNRGIATEELVQSYNYVHSSQGTVLAKNPKSEKEYLVKPVETEALKTKREILKSKSYRVLVTDNTERMEDVALSTSLNFGSHLGVTGTNNGTWQSE